MANPSQFRRQLAHCAIQQIADGNKLQPHAVSPASVLPDDKFHNALFLNPGNESGFLDVGCRGTKSNRSGFGVGAALTIEFPDGQRQTLHRGAGSLSSFGG